MSHAPHGGRWLRAAAMVVMLGLVAGAFLGLAPFLGETVAHGPPIIYQSEGGTVCNDVLTCSITGISATAGYFIAIAITDWDGSYSSETVAVHGAHMVDYISSTHNIAFTDLEGAYFTATTTATLYVNFTTTAQYYTIEYAVFSNVYVVEEAPARDYGVASSSGTAASCTMQAVEYPDTVIWAGYGAGAAEATMTPGSTAQQVAIEQTSTNVVTGEAQYKYVTTPNAAGTTTNTLATSATWDSVCVFLYPNLNGAANQVVTARSPYYMTYNPNTGYVVVVNNDNNNVTVLSNLTALSSTTVQNDPFGVCYDSSNGYMYVDNEASGSVSILGGSKYTTVEETVPVGQAPATCQYDPANGYMYVACDFSNNVTIFDGLTKIATVHVGALPGTQIGSYDDYWSVAYDPNNQYVYITNFCGTAGGGCGSTDIFNGTGILANVTNGAEPTTDVFDPANGYVYVVNEDNNNVTVFNGLTKIASIAVGNNPVGATYDAYDQEIYVSNQNAGTVTIINGTTVVKTIGAATSGSGALIGWMAYDSLSHFVFVDDTGTGNLTAINGTATVPSQNYTTYSGPTMTLYDPVNGYLYVDNGYFDGVTVMVFAPPSAPTSLQATAETNTTVSLSWTNAAAPLTNNTIYYSTTASCGGTLTHVPTRSLQTSYTVQGLNPSTTYYFEVTDWNATGQSPMSSCITAATGAAAPGAPTGLTASTVSTAQINLAWTNPSGSLTKSYVEQWSGSSCSGSGSVIDNGGSVVTSYSVTGLTASTTYSFEVAAATSGGEGPYSNCAYNTTYNAAPGAPTGLAATTISTTQINLAWTNPGGTLTASYVKQWSGSSCSGSGSVIDNGGPVITSYAVTGLTASTTYSFEVAAATNGGQGSYSACAYNITFNVAPGAPTGLTAITASISQINLAWTNPAGTLVATYIEQWTGPSCAGVGSVIDNGGPVITAYGVAGLSVATTYSFKVAAATNGGEGPYSACAENTTLPISAVVIPPFLSAAGTSVSTVAVTWTAPINVTYTNYTLRWGTTYGTYPSSAGETGATLHTTVTGLAVNTTYYFEIQAWNGTSLRITSNVAPAHTASTTPPVVIPSVLACFTTGLTTASCAWTVPQNASPSAYELKWGVVYGTYTTGNSGSLSSSTLDYAVTGLTANTTYWLIVTPTGAPSSNVVPIHTFAGTPPVYTSPLLACYATGLTTASCAWTAPQNVSPSAYELKWGTSYGTYATGNSGSLSSSTFDYAVTGLTANITYWLIVVPTGAPSSNVVPIHTFAGTPPVIIPPVLSVVAVAQTTANITWTTPQNFSVSYYIVYWGLTYGSQTYNSAQYGPTYTITGLAANTTYWVEVRTVSPGGSSLYSNSAPLRTLAPVVGVVREPVLSVVAVTSTSVVLAWTTSYNVTGASADCVEMATSFGGSTMQLYCSVRAGAGNYTATGLTANTTYWFYILVQTGFAGNDSNWAPAQTLALIAPLVIEPVLSVVGVAQKEVVVAWTAPLHLTVTNYTIEWGTQYGIYTNVLVVNASTLDAFITGLSSNTTYWFVVLVNGIGPSNVAPAQTLVTPPAPPAPPAPSCSLSDTSQCPPFVFPWDIVVAVVLVVTLIASIIVYAAATSRGRAGYAERDEEVYP